MNLFHKLLCLILLTPAITLAQSNFKPGYVVSLGGDTIKGYIDHREWGNNPKEINFKRDANAAKEAYTTKNCSGFAINGLEYYQRFVLKVSRDNVTTSTLTVGPDTSATIDTVFLRVVVKGTNASLYFYKDPLKQRFYISEQNGAPQELIRRFYLDVNQQNGLNQNSTNIITQNSYRLQLQKLAVTFQPNNQKLAEKIQKSDYEESSLQSVVNDINGDKGTQLMAAGRGSSRFFAGIAINDVNTTVSGTDEFAGLKSTSKILPSITIGNDWYINKNIGTVLIRLQAGLQYNSVKASRLEQTASPDEFLNVFKYDQITASLNPNVLYNVYNKNMLKVYLEAGASFNYSMYSNKQNAHIYTVRKETDPQPPIDFKSVWISIPIRAGIVINNRFDIFASYVPPASISDNYLYFKIESKAYQVGINYLFDRSK